MSEEEESGGSLAPGVVAKRYGGVLFELARDRGNLDPVLGELRLLSRILDERESGLRRVLVSPFFSSADRERAVLAVAERAGWGPLTKGFLLLSVRNRRASVVRGAILEFERLCAAHAGELRVEVMSAVPLSERERASFEQAAAARLGARKVRVVASVDPALLGGVAVSVGSRMIDATMRTQLALLGASMREGG